jgi:predicted small secreted protein
VTIKKAVIAGFLFFSLVILLAGCETAKGAAYGVGTTVEGAAKDTRGAGNFIMAVDDWIKENIW